jgi:hypothetical protein
MTWLCDGLFTLLVSVVDLPSLAILFCFVLFCFVLFCFVLFCVTEF